MESPSTYRKIVSELAKSTHGKLEEYIPEGVNAAEKDPEFFAHLVSWNHAKGEVRDSKKALPVIGLAVPKYRKEKEFSENSFGALLNLSPRDFVTSLDFARNLKTNGKYETPYRRFRKLAEIYLRRTERDKIEFDQKAVQHKESIIRLYTLFHVKPSDYADRILFKRSFSENTIFSAIRDLNKMSPIEAAGAIIHYKIPFLIASGAVGKKLSDESVLMALVNSMSPAELVNNTKTLEKLGMGNFPAVRGIYQKKLDELKSSPTKKLGSLKAGKAAEFLASVGMEKAAEQMKSVVENQITQKLSIEGDWLIIADCSGSMSQAIELANQISSILARAITGKVHLVFCNTEARHFDVTGKTLEEVQKITRFITAGGGTSIGIGLKYAVTNKLNFDAICIVSDGGENTPPVFSVEYTKHGNEVPVYWYQVLGDRPTLHVPEINTFDLRNKQIDYYSLPNLVKTMRVNQFSLYDEIINFPLIRPPKEFYN